MLALTTGVIKENITLEGIDLSTVKPGNVFFIGDDVTLEATGLCEPCGRMDMLRPGLQEALQERRGVLAMVLNGGKLCASETTSASNRRGAGGCRASLRRPKNNFVVLAFAGTCLGATTAVSSPSISLRANGQNRQRE